ncbi:SRPBCC family protein [Nonomuraea africana]|uniref:Carbon monoxide dehydrogenase subunit G n=1 Tax=Nonomuraea africana TaxID=46171 RepID=A0ABR9KTZ1_9ACTN|nr:SRPBCC family protein [Nonomuraea africana]MBE1565492.1 carbon monoxide dehydrogenase subunit G [Nonomuraea africana]
MAMRFEHEFTVPVPIEQAWAALLDVERVAPCLPGATLDIVEGEEFTGRMKVKVGPITVTYKGTARFEDVDKDAYTLTLNASGKEARGSGTASATVTARLLPADDATAVSVETAFNVTGRPAQFGRGVMAEVGGKLIDRFAENLAGLLGESQSEERHLAAVPELDEEEDVRPSGTLRTSRTPDEEALDLLEIAGTPLLKRVAPIAGAIAGLLFLVWLIRRIIR